MPEILQKLTPDRDLQCYFERPSAIAALSNSSPNGFVVSGTWRQQFDWAVIEWNRDNVIEHPVLRNLPDGNLSDLKLTYTETRENCLQMDSNWYPTVDWPFLRIWAEDQGIEQLYKVRLRDHAEPIQGTWAHAWAEFELAGSITPGDYVELAWLSEHYTIQLFSGQSLSDIASLLAEVIDAESPTATATATGSAIRIRWRIAGANGNRIGVYANVAGQKTETWEPRWQRLHDGVSPQSWRVMLDFGDLVDIEGRLVPTSDVRKLRWTYAADMQHAAFERSEFRVSISDWSVSGDHRQYQIAGPGSRRVEDDCDQMVYSGAWSVHRGNFSGGSIHKTSMPDATVSFSYAMPTPHRLYLGTRRHAQAPVIAIRIDGSTREEGLAIPGEDVLVRVDLGERSAGTHTIVITHKGRNTETFYVDFIELAVPCYELPTFPADPVVTLATDWDTDHSITIAPERVAWLIHTLGFHGRANHYVGALWFYELQCPGNRYATLTVQFSGSPAFGELTELRLGPTTISHRNLIGDTAESVAKALEFEINAGSSAVWAQAQDGDLFLQARAMGRAGETLTVAVSTNSEAFAGLTSATSLSGGVDGEWITDLHSSPRLNRAARDWSRSFYRALKACDIEVTAAFSMELQHGDSSVEAGIAQRYPNGDPVLLLTPALQTNFSPASTAYWNQVYLEMAQVMQEAECAPYLQFGEVQWWYFPAKGGMPFYDSYTTTRFQSTYGRPLRTFIDGDERPSDFREECEYLAGLIGEFTEAIISFVRQTYPDAKFEVLYAPDVNEKRLNEAINFPLAQWCPNNLDCLKTENFTFTGNRDLNRAKSSIQLPRNLGFPRSKSSHLVGISDYTTPWQKETRACRSEGVESIVLFALDQFCLIGYPPQLERGSRRSFAR